jgi:hypothetical protein
VKPSAVEKTVVPPDYDKTIRQRGGGVDCNKRFVVVNLYNDKPNKFAVRAKKVESVSLPAVANRLQDKPSAAESGGVGAAVNTCDSKILKVSFKAVNIRVTARARRLAERQQTVPQALLSAERGFWGSAPNYFPI